MRPLPRGELRLGAAGADYADVDAILAKFGVERLGEADLRELGRAVDGLTSGTLEASDGRDELDDAGALGDHQRRRVASEKEAGAHVGSHEVVVVRGRGVHEVLVVPCSGVVDEDVEVAEGLCGKRDGAEGGRLFGGISGVEDGLVAQCVNLGAECYEAFGAACGDDDVGPLTGEGEGGGAADASACSGDEDDSSGEGGRAAHA